MQGKDQIIALGKLLAAEERDGCNDTAVPEGLEAFLDEWCAHAVDALGYPEVQETLALLAGYSNQPAATRRQRTARALNLLRGLFKPRPAEASEPLPASAAQAEPVEPAAQTVARNSPRQTPRPASKKPVAAPARPVDLDTSIEAIHGIGPANARSFRKLGVQTVRDLLYHFPHRYDDYSSRKTIAELTPGAVETVIAEVRDVRTFRMRNGRESVEVTVGDDTGNLKAVFFGMGWLVRQLAVGRQIVLSGKVDLYQGLRQMSSPDWEPYSEDELLHTGRLVPVHPLTKGLHERNARRIIKEIIDRAVPLVAEYLPEESLQRAGLIGIQRALQQIHFPDTPADLEQARKRLGFDEFLFIQLGVLQRKMLWQGERGYAFSFHEEVHEQFLNRLPFELTGAQVRSLEELFADLRRPVPMARLLQGDVGSGKTAVAAAVMLQAVANGFQAAMMAPTEILAEQHYKGLRRLLGQIEVPRAQTEPVSGTPLSAADIEHQAQLDEIKRLLGMTPADDLGGQGVRVALLTGSLKGKERQRVLEGIQHGDVDLVIGTHALIMEGVQFNQLGLAVVDEQHRFGVEQRGRLRSKGFNPHMLVMTATPIPRTLTLTIYGDLDTSVLDELPPGRQEIRTRWIPSAEREKAYKHIRKEVARGRQVYVICPLVEESEKINLPSAIEMHERLQSEVFPDLRVGLIHGQLLPREKDDIMRAFGAHEYDILVATAVVEVGIDVPNATTILIEGAERFGLSQLHQFRGRVGRGMHQSYCILVSDQDNEVTRQRLEALEQTRDGFKLAEVDLQLRGPGEFFGTRQSGTPDLKIAQLSDSRLLHVSRLEAQHLLAADPKLEQPRHSMLRTRVTEFWAAANEAGSN